MASTRSIGIDTLKAAAAFLIINSHLEPMYPRPWMAADGMLGNTIFFFTTGITLTGSMKRRPDESFVQFLWKRLFRLYPAVWIALVFVPPSRVDWSAVLPVLKSFFYPTPYSFLATIVPFYPLFYFLMKARPSARSLFLYAALTAAAVAFAWMRLPGGNGASIPWGELGRAPWLPHFAAALIAGSAWETAPHERAPSGVGGRLAAAWLLLAATYLMLRFSATSTAPPALRSALGGLRVLAIPASLLLAACSLKVLESSKWLAGAWRPVVVVIAFVSAHTWETYLVHEGIARWGFVKRAAFPLGLLLVVAFTMCLAPILRRLASIGRSARGA